MLNVLLSFVFTDELHGIIGRLLGNGSVLLLHKRGCVLHLKDSVLAEVDESLQFFLISFSYDGVEESSLRFLDLRLLPLFDLVLLYLEVDSLNPLAATHNLDTTQEVLEVIEDRPSSLGR